MGETRAVEIYIWLTGCIIRVARASDKGEYVKAAPGLEVCCE